MTAKEETELMRLSVEIRHMGQEIARGRDDIQALHKRVDELTRTIDDISGGKKALIWVTGVALTLAGLTIALINTLKHN